MRFTNKFPYTNINNINLDWIIKRVKELGETVLGYAQDIANAVALAEAAQEAAESVTSTAESAVTTAQAAEATANAIAGTANTALATAQAAETTANAIADTANTALNTARAAETTAQAAETTAQTAETTAQAAEETAQEASETANTAAANVASAVQTANTALATADAANTTARAISATANEALSTASAALASAEETAANVETLTSEVSQQQSAIEDIYPTATVIGRSVKIPSAFERGLISFTKEAVYSASYVSSFLEVYNHSLLAGVKWFPDTTIDADGNTSSLGNRWTTDYIDIHTLSSVTLRLLYNWGSSYRVRAWTYKEDKSPNREVVSNAGTSRNTIFNLSLNDIDYYLRFSMPSYQEPYVYIGNCVELVDSGDIHRYPLDLGEFYGGNIDFISGVVIPKYDSAGAEIVAPIPFDIEPIVLNVSDNTSIYMTQTGNYYNIAGDFTVSYKMGVQEYIDQQTNATRGLIAGIEPNMTASKAYSTGDLLIVGDTLYKAATAIASGAALTPGTNVNATTVAEQLILLANT